MPPLPFNYVVRMLRASTSASGGVSTSASFYDTFTDTNNTAIASHTPDINIAPGWTSSIGTWVINNANAAWKTSAGDSILVGPDAPTDDYQIEVTLNGSSGATADGPIFRALDANNFYGSFFDSTPSVYIPFKREAGSYTTQGNSVVSTSGNPRTIKVNVIGPIATTYSNGQLVGIRIYEKFPNARKFGFRMAGTPSANSIDNFTVKSIIPTTPQVVQFTSAAATDKVIFDADFNTDAGEIPPLQIMHALVKSGEAEIVACTTMVRNADVVNAMYGVNSYYGRSSITMGVTSKTLFTTAAAWTTSTASTYGSGGPGLTAENAITVMRQKLNAAADGSVIIISGGYLTNLSDLLQSGANHLGDGISSTGLQLVTQKVKRLAVMAGCFGYRSDGGTLGGSKEFNALGDGTSTAYVFNNWPTSVPIFISGYEIGAAGIVSSATPLYTLNREFWDHLLPPMALRGGSWGGTDYWKFSRGVLSGLEGGISYMPDPAGNAYIMRESAPIATVTAQLKALAETAP